MTTKLLVPKGKFASDLNLRIAEGKALLDIAQGSLNQQQFMLTEKNFRIWDDYNQEWLINSFTLSPNKYSQQYEVSSTGIEKLKFIKLGYSPEAEYYRRAFLAKDIANKIEHLESLLSRVDLLPQEDAQHQHTHTPNAPISLHPTVQQVATSLFATNHYPQAIQAACTALEKAIQQKSGQSASMTGTTLIGKAFPKDNPLICLSDDQGEREGYGFLYRGLLQAIRNHYAHNLTEIPAARALEWLSFISALFYKLDEAQPAATPPTR